MITFFAGVSATVLVGILVWLIIDVVRMLKKVKSLEEAERNIIMTIDLKYDAIERKLGEAIDILNRRIDDNYSYTDSRFDKLENKLSNKK
jgi:hypothetical protein